MNQHNNNNRYNQQVLIKWWMWLQNLLNKLLNKCVLLLIVSQMSLRFQLIIILTEIHILFLKNLAKYQWCNQKTNLLFVLNLLLTNKSKTMMKIWKIWAKESRNLLLINQVKTKQLILAVKNRKKFGYVKTIKETRQQCHTSHYSQVVVRV